MRPPASSTHVVVIPSYDTGPLVYDTVRAARAAAEEDVARQLGLHDAHAARQPGDDEESVEHGRMVGRDEPGGLIVAQDVERARIDLHQAEPLGARPAAAIEERHAGAAESAPDPGRQQEPEKRGQQGPDERHRPQLDDDAREEDAVPQRRRLGGFPAQSSVSTRWLEVAKIHEMPKPAVTVVSLRTSGLGANFAPCRLS